MSIPVKVLLGIAASAVLVLAWGYWHSLRHASLQFRIDDYALKSDTQAFGVPHGATLRLLDSSKSELALARSVEPLGYILAIHPNAEIGNCEHREIGASATQGSQAKYAACYKLYSAWSASWAARVRSADIAVGSCVVREVPMRIYRSNNEWWLWWVPLPHVGGLPRQYFEFSVAIDSRACAPVSRQSGSLR